MGHPVGGIELYAYFTTILALSWLILKLALNRLPDDDDGAAGAADLPNGAGEETGDGLGLAGIISGEGGLR